MTHAAVSTQLVALVKAVSPTHQPAVFGEVFEHVRELGPGRYGASRQFNVLSPSGAKHARRRIRAVNDFDLVVDYQAHTDQYALDRAIHSDAELLAASLGTPGDWGRPTSTILVVFPDGDDVAAHTVEVVENADGAIVTKRLRLAFTVEHTT